MPERMERLKKLIKNEICAILSEDINDPRIKHVTVTDVDLSKDLRNAVVRYVIEDEKTDREDVARGLRSAGGFIRGELAERISMKYMPRVIFRLDGSEDKDEGIDRLFDMIAREREGANDGEEGE